METKIVQLSTSECDSTVSCIGVDEQGTSNCILPFCKYCSSHILVFSESRFVFAGNCDPGFSGARYHLTASQSWYHVRHSANTQLSAYKDANNHVKTCTMW